MRRLAKTEAGFGLVELLIAMTVMVIAIMGIVAAFSSGFLALNRASAASTAATLAEKQMESFRKMSYASIPIGTTSVTVPGSQTSDGRQYRIDSAIQLGCPLNLSSTTCARPVKLVTIAVYDPTTAPATQLFSETSTFDQATG